MRQNDGNFVLLRADGDEEGEEDEAPDEMRVVLDDCTNRALRRSPYPIRNPESEEKWLVYLVEEPEHTVCENRPNQNFGNCLQLWAVDLENAGDCGEEEDHTVIYDEWKTTSQATGLESGFFRWAEASFLLFHGYFSWDAAPLGGAVTAIIARQEFDGGLPTAIDSVTTNDQVAEPYDVVDNFPYLTSFLVFGYDADDGSEVWVPDGDIYKFESDVTWEAGESQIASASNAFGSQSFETFVWGEGVDADVYAAYVILDNDGTAPTGRQPYAYEGEIWVQKVDDPTVNCLVNELTVEAPIVNPDGQSSKFEPEPIVRDDIPYIYYNEGPPTTDLTSHQFNLRRITITASKETFDTQCALNNVWDY